MNVLETSRLNLRELHAADAAFILELVNEPAWLRFIGKGNIKTLDAARDYILNGPVAMYARRGFGLWLVELRDTRTPVGICGLLKREALDDIDLGFAFLSAHQRKGYAFEAATATLDYAKSTLAVARIAAIMSPDNDASARLLEKLGFVFERTVRLAADKPEVKLYAVAL